MCQGTHSANLQRQPVMSDQKSIIRNLIWLFSGHVLSALCLFAAMAYAARILGPSDFGVINFGEVVFMFFLTLSNMGLTFLGTRDIARHPEKTGFYGVRVLSLRLFLACVLFIMLLCAVYFLPASFSTKYTIAIYGAGLIPASLFLDWLFLGLEKMTYVALSVFVRSLVFLAGILLFVHGRGDFSLVPLIFFLSWLSSSGVLFLIYRKKVGLLSFLWDLPFFRKFLKDASPVGVSLLVGWVIHYFDSSLLFLLKGERVAGEYNAAYRPIILMVTALTVYFNSIFPRLSRAVHESSASIKKIVYWTVQFGCVVFLPVAVIGAFRGQYLMVLLYGAAFRESGAIFSILVWWPLLVLLVTNYSRILLCYDQQRHVGRFSLITACLNILFNVVMVPLMGGVGAACSKIGADAMTYGIYYRFTRKILVIPFWRLLKTSLLGAGVMTLFFLVVRSWPLGYSLLVGILLYIVSFLAIHFFVFKQKSLFWFETVL